jgi:hypothetical protein
MHDSLESPGRQAAEEMRGQERMERPWSKTERRGRILVLGANVKEGLYARAAMGAMRRNFSIFVAKRSSRGDF